MAVLDKLQEPITNEVAFRTRLGGLNFFEFIFAEFGLMASFGRTLFDPYAQKEYGLEAMRRAQPSLLNPAEYRDYLLRHPEQRTQIMQQFSKLGLPEAETAWFEELGQVIPGPSDLIRLAVREAFNDEFATTFSLDQEFPPEFAQFGSQVGLSEFWTQKFWRAHWELPSTIRGFEMLQRLRPEILRVRGDAYRSVGLEPANLEFTFNQLRDLLKAQDFAPFWRDRLAAIAFSPITRIDLRRIYNQGLISDEQFIARQQELGYTRADSELILAWVKADNTKEERDITKSEILNSLKFGLITRTDAISLLQLLRFGPASAELIVQVFEAKVASKKKTSTKQKTKEDTDKHRDLTKAEIIKAVKIGQIDIPDAMQMLQELGYDREDATFIINVNLAAQKTDERQITRTMIEKQYELGIITRTAAISLLIDLGFSPQAAQNITQTVLTKKQLDVQLLPFGYARGLFKANIYSEERFRNYLFAAGYHDDDVEAVIRREKQQRQEIGA